MLRRHGVELAEGRAGDALHHQHAFAAQVGEDPRGKDAFGVRVERVEILLVARLVAEIELAHHAVARLGQHALHVDRPQGGHVLLHQIGRASCRERV